MDFLSKFTKETHWKSLYFQSFPTFSRFRNFQDTFLRDEKIIFYRKNIFLTQNLSRNPKIILRKPYGKAKYTKNEKIRFLYTKYHISTRCCQFARNKPRLRAGRSWKNFIRACFYAPEEVGRISSGLAFTRRKKNHFIRKKFHPEEVSSGRNFIRKKFHPEEVSSGRNFIRKKFHLEEISSGRKFSGRSFIRKKFHPEEVFSSGRNFIRKKFLPEEVSSGRNFIRKKFHPEEISSGRSFIRTGRSFIRKKFHPEEVSSGLEEISSELEEVSSGSNFNRNTFARNWMILDVLGGS